MTAGLSSSLSRIAARAFRKTSSPRFSIAFTPSAPPARNSAPIPGWACRSPSKSSRCTAARSGRKTARAPTAPSPEPAFASACRRERDPNLAGSRNRRSDRGRSGPVARPIRRREIRSGAAPDRSRRSSRRRRPGAAAPPGCAARGAGSRSDRGDDRNPRRRPRAGRLAAGGAVGADRRSSPFGSDRAHAGGAGRDRARCRRSADRGGPVRTFRRSKTAPNLARVGGRDGSRYNRLMRTKGGRRGSGAAKSAAPARVLLVTGMSGAGRSTALKTLEDLGYETFDNLPASLVPALVESAAADGPPIAVGADTRTRGFAAETMFETLADIIGRTGRELAVLFIDCDDERLERRYTETRRPHPLAGDRSIMD